MKRWQVAHTLDSNSVEEIIDIILRERGIKTKKDTDYFVNPPHPLDCSASNVGISSQSVGKALARIHKAIKANESIVVYADYDADGITAGAIMWEALFTLGARVMPYIPHRVEEGYGLSVKGIDAVRERFDPTLIITVDHGITAHEKVAYAKKLGIDVMVTDHHVKPDKLPQCTIVHTTKLAGSGVSWFVAKELLKKDFRKEAEDLLVLAAIGTVADLVPLVGPNRAIAKFGLEGLNTTSRVGLKALITDAGLTKGSLGTYDISHVLAPRLNAMGRLEHALDALRLLCTHKEAKATLLAQKLGLTNRERQQLTIDTTVHARDLLGKDVRKKLIFISHASYNQGVIGLVAGRLVEEFYRPTIVVSRGEEYSKASARSIAGFNIVEAIRKFSDLVVDVGGHPMAAGFTVETKHLAKLQKQLEDFAEKELDEALLTRMLKIDAAIPLEFVSEKLWLAVQRLQPFGFGNPEPVFASRNVRVVATRLVGQDGKHIKLRVMSVDGRSSHEAIAFGMGNQYAMLQEKPSVDIAYTIDMNEWNGSRTLQLKVKDIVISS